MNASSQKLGALDAVRGAAALLVLLHHAFGSVEQPQNYGTRLLGGIFEEGRMGVNIFFVLSGFVITWAHPQDHRSPREILIYALRRIARIYPLYWLALVAMLVLRTKFGFGSTGEITAGRVASELLLLPYPSEMLVWGAWTLVFEITFYMLFIVMLISRPAGLSIMGALALAIVGLLLAGITPENRWLLHITSPYVLQFFFGVAVCLWAQRRTAGPCAARWMVAGGSLAMVALALGRTFGGMPPVAANLHYAVCAAVIIMGVVSLPGRPDAAQSRILGAFCRLGLYTYSIYLFHVPVQKALIKTAMKITGVEPGVPVVWAVVILSVVVSAGVGILIGRFIEIPLLEKCKKWIAKLKPRKLPLPSAPPPAMA